MVVVPVATAGPLPAITPRDPLNDALAEQVEEAQDDLWPYRDAMVQDVEATVQEVGFIGDARAVLADSAAEPLSGTYTLLDASTTPDSTQVTLALTASSETGGGWWYSRRTAAVCFTLVFPHTELTILTQPADCGSTDPSEPPALPGFELATRAVPLDELDVRLTVTEDDYPVMPCQCASGGDCDCPGG
jgi:hypothetical protein